MPSIPTALCLARHTPTPTTPPSLQPALLSFALQITHHKYKTSPGGRTCRTRSRGSGVESKPSRTRRRFVRAGFSSPANLNRIARSRSSTFYSDSVQHLITSPLFFPSPLSLSSLLRLPPLTTLRSFASNLSTQTWPSNSTHERPPQTLRTKTRLGTTPPSCPTPTPSISPSPNTTFVSRTPTSPPASVPSSAQRTRQAPLSLTKPLCQRRPVRKPSPS